MAIDRITLAGLIKLALPGGDVRLSDGGTVTFDGEQYSSIDPVLGVINAVDTLREGIDESAPAFDMEFLPNPDETAADLTDPALQGCRVRAWDVEVDEDAGTVIGDGNLIADAMIDVPRLSWAAAGRVLTLACVSVWQRLVGALTGNWLNGGFHQRQWPDETGLDNANGVTLQVAWGVAGVRGIVTAGGGGGGGGGGADGPWRPVYV